jgi:ABC-type cobalamin/Fe3+-siderophores transport system ATPase subunit
LQRNFFRRSIGRVVTDPAQLAALSIALAQETEVVRLTRPTSGFALDELCELVLK